MHGLLSEMKGGCCTLMMLLTIKEPEHLNLLLSAFRALASV